MSFTVKERTLRLIGIPVLSLVLSFVFNDDPVDTPGDFARNWFVSFVFTALIWEGNRALVEYFRRRFPRNDHTARRLLLQAPTAVVLTVGVSLLIDELLHRAGLLVCTPDEMLAQALYNLIPTAFIMPLYESAYFFEEWKKNFRRSEALARENVISQFEALKSQLDPHFLFNSFNTLAALIDPKNERAQTYLEELSDVYRYVLVSRHLETVPLREELQFVESYLYLNKTRFRDNLVVENEIPDAVLDQRVAPLSLQILVENALKHNVIAKERPLTLRLAVEANGYLVVTNNLQPRAVLADKSTKTGLQNVVSRYALLTPLRVRVEQSAGWFTVTLPLLHA
ncbi:MAG: histidine kinase [Catalinimonas sp.]